MKFFRPVLIILLLNSLSVQSFTTEHPAVTSTATITTALSFTLSGTVVDRETGEELVCARIIIRETGESYFTDILGNFTIPGIIPGKTTLMVSYISYQETIISDLNPQNGKLIISLQPH